MRRLAGPYHSAGILLLNTVGIAAQRIQRKPSTAPASSAASRLPRPNARPAANTAGGHRLARENFLSPKLLVFGCKLAPIGRKREALSLTYTQIARSRKLGFPVHFVIIGKALFGKLICFSRVSRALLPTRSARSVRKKANARFPHCTLWIGVILDLNCNAYPL